MNVRVRISRNGNYTPMSSYQFRRMSTFVACPVTTCNRYTVLLFKSHSEVALSAAKDAFDAAISIPVQILVPVELTVSAVAPAV